MASTRARLTITYAGLLLVTTIVFSAIYFVRLGAAVDQLEAVARGEAIYILDVLTNSHRDGNVLATTTMVVDSAGGHLVVNPSPALSKLLEAQPGYFLVIGNQGTLLFRSPAPHLLTPTDEAALDSAAVTISTDAHMVLVPSQSGGRLAMVAMSDTATGPNIARVVGVVPASMPDLWPQLLIGSTLILAPLVILLSLGGAYGMSGHIFKPVESLMTELEAITDGRSLHRRLPTESADDEMGQLAETLNRMIERLDASFSGLRRFTADASHELKTPLTVLRADVERAMHPGTPAREQLVALEEAMHETTRMADLVDSLLTLARADEGRFEIHREPLALEPLVREVSETAIILGEDAGLAVSLPLVEDAIVLGDRTRLRQLFLNLITNAIKYTPRGGRVEMTLSHRNNNEVAFSVRDTGIGISAGDLPNVFERFWRADRARSRASDRGGFGLGLAIAQWITQAHGGVLTVQSRLGRGSIFIVTLPRIGPDSSVETSTAG